MLDPPNVFTYRDGVAVIQVFFFAIFLCLAFVLCSRHGFRRSEGWIILITFSILRLLGASFQLAAIKYPNDSVYGGALICEEIGLAPLILLNFGIFQRLNKWVQKVHKLVFTLISLVTIVGLVLGIYGGIESAESANLESNDLLKAGVMCFLGSYFAFAGLFLYFLTQRRKVPARERQLLYCFAYCSPFMTIRLLYSILPDFDGRLRPSLQPLVGNITAFLLLAVVEEIAIVALFIYTGLRLKELPPDLKYRSITLKTRSERERSWEEEECEMEGQ